jgi:hypothetical protein
MHHPGALFIDGKTVVCSQNGKTVWAVSVLAAYENLAAAASKLAGYTNSRQSP